MGAFARPPFSYTIRHNNTHSEGQGCREMGGLVAGDENGTTKRKEGLASHQIPEVILARCG